MANSITLFEPILVETSQALQSFVVVIFIVISRMLDANSPPTITLWESSPPEIPDHSRDVVFTTAFVGQRDELSTCVAQGTGFTHNIVKLNIADLVRKAVAAQQQIVSADEGNNAYDRRGFVFSSDRMQDNVAIGRVRR
jgi:hypothetical protein